MLRIEDNQVKAFEQAARREVLEQHRDLLIRHRPKASEIVRADLDMVLNYWHGQGTAFKKSCDLYMFVLVCYDRGPDFPAHPMIQKILGRERLEPIDRLDAALVWANQYKIGGPSDGGLKGVRKQKERLVEQKQ